jgi:hypothetical protein
MILVFEFVPTESTLTRRFLEFGDFVLPHVKDPLPSHVFCLDSKIHLIHLSRLAFLPCSALIGLNSEIFPKLMSKRLKGFEIIVSLLWDSRRSDCFENKLVEE